MLGGATIVAFVVALAASRLLLSRFGRLALDEPNARSMHKNPVPRTGGIAVMAGTAASLALGISEIWLPMTLALALAAVSFVDDLHGMPTAVRLLAHSAAAAVLVWHILSPMHLLTLGLLFLAVVWVTNLYNFMDGSDGLAGGMSVIGFSAYGIAALRAVDLPLAGLCAALAAASAGFLVYNFHPAKIFLGDVGAIPLGFLAGALGLLGWRNDDWPLWFPLLVFGPFIADATVTLLKRLIRGERVWQAHRDHYYQRILLMGFGHRGTAYLGYAVMAFCALAALYGREQAAPAQAAIFGAASVLLAAMAVWVEIRWSRFRRTDG
jgi:UDP-N-acetylmuramyl pentapeptide phosphotransferase/UDP-N-acetylglucosamine-1-phosphate transferase